MKKEMPAGLVKGLLEALIKGGLDLQTDEETKVSFLPEEYYTEFFEEIVKARGIPSAREFIKRDGTLSEAFPWLTSTKGHEFWRLVEDEVRENYQRLNGVVPTQNPKTKATSNTSESIDDVIKEAESRGFAEGVSTKYGVIRNRRTPSHPILDHELQDDGTFYYRNIKVRNSKGKWIKANVDVKPDYRDAAESSDAIHGQLEAMIKMLSK